MAKTMLLCTVYLFAISLKLCQRTTVWNTDASNCYITRWLLVSDCCLLYTSDAADE